MNTQAARRNIYATLIVNPVSGVGNSKGREATIKQSAKALGWKGEYIETTKEKSAGMIAKEEVARGVKHLIICGGDGTVAEVLKYFVDKKITLGIVPLGTGNLLARNLSLPLDIKEAMETAFVGNQKIIDVGQANGTYFGVMAGIGLDAEVMKSTKRQMKDRWGFIAYAVTAVKRLKNKAGIYDIKLDNKKPFTVRAKSILVSNMGKIMGGVEVVPFADSQSGSFRLGIIKAHTGKDWLNLFSHALFKRIDNSPHYDTFEAKEVVIHSTRGAKVYECDGDHFPATETLSITIYPKSVTVLVKPEVIGAGDEIEKKVLLFDFDGTLGDSLALVISIYNTIAKKYKYPPLTAKASEEMRGKSARMVMAELPISKLKLPTLFLEGKREFTSQFENIKPFPELPKILSLLAKKYTLGIVTSNDSTYVKKFLINNNMDYFDFVHSDGSLFGKGKVIKKVLMKYKFSEENVMYIGDEVRDIEAAREAGIRVVSVAWGFNTKKALKSSNPDHVISSPKELLSLDSLLS